MTRNSIISKSFMKLSFYIHTIERKISISTYTRNMLYVIAYAFVDFRLTFMSKYIYNKRVELCYKIYIFYAISRYVYDYDR